MQRGRASVNTGVDKSVIAKKAGLQIWMCSCNVLFYMQPCFSLELRFLLCIRRHKHLFLQFYVQFYNMEIILGRTWPQEVKKGAVSAWICRTCALIWAPHFKKLNYMYLFIICIHVSIWTSKDNWLKSTVSSPWGPQDWCKHFYLSSHLTGPSLLFL